MIPYIPILTRPLEDMNHGEAQEEIGDSLMLMFDHVRQQTDQIQELLAIEEAQTLTSKLGKSTTKRSTYQPSDSMSLYSQAAGSSVMGSVNGGLSSKVAQIKLDNRTDAKEDRKLDRIAAEAQAFLDQN